MRFGIASKEISHKEVNPSPRHQHASQEARVRRGQSVQCQGRDQFTPEFHGGTSIEPGQSRG